MRPEDMSLDDLMQLARERVDLLTEEQAAAILHAIGKD